MPGWKSSALAFFAKGATALTELLHLPKNDSETPTACPSALTCFRLFSKAEQKAKSIQSGSLAAWAFWNLAPCVLQHSEVLVWKTSGSLEFLGKLQVVRRLDIGLPPPCISQPRMAKIAPASGQSKGQCGKSSKSVFMSPTMRAGPL